MRIISLLPSATEIVCALGLKDQLVGRSHECDYPPGIETLPALTRPKLPVHGTSAAIHRSVTSILKLSLSVYEVEEELLRALEPDFIVTQTQCEICAVSLKDLEKALEHFVGKKPGLIPLAPFRLSDILEDIHRVASILGVEDAARKLLAHLHERILALKETLPQLPPRRQRVLVLEWLDPPMVGLNWMPELLELVGAEPVVQGAGAPSRRLSWEEIPALDPDLLLIIPCGFPVEKTMEELPGFLKRPELQRLRAVQEGNVYVADGNAYFNRPGPRIVDSLEIVAEILYPGLYPQYRNPAVFRRVSL